MSDGRLLAGTALREALDKGRVFLPSTWDQHHLRTTGYDLRVAGDRLILTGESGEAIAHPPGDPIAHDIILQPGDNAFLSTMERVCLDWDVVGNIGPKFSLAAQGLLVLTGLIVDPGYGQRRVRRQWRPDPESRLHFVVANVGPEPITLRPGDSIAAIQFYAIAPVPAAKRTATPSIGYDQFARYFRADAPAGMPGLAYFRSVRETRERAALALDKAAELNAQAYNLLLRVEQVEKGSNFVVTFGVYLVSTTIIAVVLTMLLTAVNDIPNDPQVWQVAPLVGGAIVLGGFTLYALTVAMRRLERIAALRAESEDGQGK